MAIPRHGEPASEPFGRRRTLVSGYVYGSGDFITCFFGYMGDIVSSVDSTFCSGCAYFDVYNPTCYKLSEEVSMSAPYDSRDVAAYIAQQCDAKRIPYNNTKIQKLLYCVYGCYLAWKKERVCDEYPRAWKYGPVFPMVFNYFHEHNDISHFSSTIQNSDDQDVKYVVDDLVIPSFAKYPASQLSAWTHKPGSPWDKTVNGDGKNEGDGLNGFIPDGFIFDYFHDKVLENAGQ